MERLGTTVRDGSIVPGTEARDAVQACSQCQGKLAPVPELKSLFLPSLTKSSVLHRLESPAHHPWEHRRQISLPLLLGPFLFLGWFPSNFREQASRSPLTVPELACFVTGLSGLVQEGFDWSVGTIVGFQHLYLSSGGISGYPDQT